MNCDNQKNFYSGPPKKNRPLGKPLKKRRSVLSVLLTIALALVALLLAVITAGYFSITHRPADYLPRQWSADPKLRQEEQRQVNRWADEKARELNHGTQFNAQKETPFVFRLEQNKLNDFLMTDETQKWIRWKWPSFHQQFRDIQFGFDEEKIKIMGLVNYKEIETVLTIAFSLHVTEDECLQIALDAVDAGALPLPKTVIDDQLHRITKILKSARNARIENVSHNKGSEDVEEFIGLLGGLIQDLLEKRNMDVPAEFMVDVNKKARILALDIGQGYVDLTLKPFWVEE